MAANFKSLVLAHFQEDPEGYETAAQAVPRYSVSLERNEKASVAHVLLRISAI